jgi:CubicO group peptidase (beta-lactamase class C family)
VPGLAACIVKGDEVIWKNAYGFANIDKQKPFRLESVMHIASVSKLFTTTAIMQLWEQGKLELDTDINEYLPISVRNPKFPDASITVRQLLLMVLLIGIVMPVEIQVFR